MKKILFLPKYPRMGASSRLRTYQYIPLWEEAGYGVRAEAFFNDHYLKEKYKGEGVDSWNVLGCYLRRFWVLLSVWRYDIIWLEKELFPFVPAWAEWVLHVLGKEYFVDYDDAVFHRYDKSRREVVRRFLGKKIDHVMKYAALVWVGNEYLAEWAKKAGANRVVVLPTVVDMGRYQGRGENLEGRFGKDEVGSGKLEVGSGELGDGSGVGERKVVIGWIGSPTTIKYLKEMLPMLGRLNKVHGFELLVVNGDRRFSFEGNVRFIPWTEEGEVDAIREMDIGIMPLPDDEWERGKCAYKLIQYMACGLPVVASPVGMNKEVVKSGENGFLASDEKEWMEYLGSLVQDRELREKLGRNGLALVRDKYVLEGSFGRIMREVGR